MTPKLMQRPKFLHMKRYSSSPAIKKMPIKITVRAVLAGMAQWNEHRPVNWKVAGLIPSQGTCLGCRPGPQLGLCDRQPIDVSFTHIHVSLPLSPFI